MMRLVREGQRKNTCPRKTRGSLLTHDCKAARSGGFPFSRLSAGARRISTSSRPSGRAAAEAMAGFDAAAAVDAGVGSDAAPVGEF